jgi:HEAT repeat protein
MKRLLTFALGALLLGWLAGAAAAQPAKPAPPPAPGDKPAAPPALPPSVAELAQLLRDPKVEVRRGAAFALKYNLQSDLVIENLIIAFKDTDEIVRSNAVDAIALMTPKVAVPPLTQALQSGDPLVRANAARTIGRLQRYSDDAVPRLVFMLKDENFDARQAAVEALKKIYRSTREY